MQSPQKAPCGYGGNDEYRTKSRGWINEAREDKADPVRILCHVDGGPARILHEPLTLFAPKSNASHHAGKYQGE